MPRVYIVAIMVCILGVTFLLHRQHTLSGEFAQLSGNFYDMKEKLIQMNNIVSSLEDNFLRTSAMISPGAEALLEDFDKGFYFKSDYYCAQSRYDDEISVVQFDKEAKGFREWVFSPEYDDFDPNAIEVKREGSYRFHKAQFVAVFDDGSRIGGVINSADSEGGVLSFIGDGFLLFHLKNCPADMR